MTRILHVMTAPRAEGTPRLVLDWLSVAGHEQGVAFLSETPDDLGADFRRTGCWLRVAPALVRGPRKFFRIACAARDWVKEFRPDVVIAWPTGFSHWVFLGARAAGSHAVLLSHGGNPPEEKWFGRYIATWICLWTTAACGGQLVTCSRYVQRCFQRIPLVPARTVVFAYNALRAADVGRCSEISRRDRAPGAPFRAIMVATLELHKDHATLIRAARRLRDLGVALEIHVVGAGSRAAALRELAAILEVDSLVTFLGSRRDVPELLGQSDLFVFSTTPQEGFGIVLFEALAAGLPVLASDVEAVREVLAGGRWGRLVPAGDDAALAAALADAVEGLTSEEETPAAKRAYAASFTPEKMVEDYLAIARSAAPENQSRVALWNSSASHVV